MILTNHHTSLQRSFESHRIYWGAGGGGGASYYWLAETIFKFLAILQANYHIVGVLKLAVVGVFTPWKLAHATN